MRYTHDDLFQAPNLPIKVAVVASLGAFAFFWLPLILELFAIIAFGAWFTWAWLELFDGTNPVRRVLGGAVLALTIAAAFVGLRIALGL